MSGGGRPRRRSRPRSCPPFGAGDGGGRRRAVAPLRPFACRASREGDLAQGDDRGGNPPTEGGGGVFVVPPPPHPPPRGGGGGGAGQARGSRGEGGTLSV